MTKVQTANQFQELYQWKHQRRERFLKRMERKLRAKEYYRQQRHDHRYKSFVQ